MSHPSGEPQRRRPGAQFPEASVDRKASPKPPPLTAGPQVCQSGPVPRRPDSIEGCLDGVDGLVVDLDGTLASLGWRRAQLWRTALRHPGLARGLPRAIEASRGSRSHGLHAAWARAAGVEPNVVEAVLRHEVPALFARLTPRATVVALLDEARTRGIPAAVVSDHAGVEKLRALGLLHHFSAVVDCSDHGAIKPLGDGLFAALAVLGTVPSRTLVVGDRPETDGSMASAVGARYRDVRSLQHPRRRSSVR